LLAYRKSDGIRDASAGNRKVVGDLHSGCDLVPISTPDPSVILGSDASYTERNPVDADAADLGGATGVPATSAVRSRKESTRDAK